MIFFIRKPRRETQRDSEQSEPSTSNGQSQSTLLSKKSLLPPPPPPQIQPSLKCPPYTYTKQSNVQPSLSKSTMSTTIAKQKQAPAHEKNFASRINERFGVGGVGDKNVALNRITAKFKLSQTKKLIDANGKESHKMKMKHSKSWDNKNSNFMSKSSSTNSHKKETRSTVINTNIVSQASSNDDQFQSEDSVYEYNFSTPSTDCTQHTRRYGEDTSTLASTPFATNIYHMDTDEIFAESFKH